MTSYVLDSNFHGEVAIEAVDRAGNSARKAVLVGQPAEAGFPAVNPLVLIALVASGFFMWILWLRRRSQ
jgi:hypothetical protein